MENYFGGSSGHMLADKRYALALQLAEWGDFSASADLLRQGIELAPAWPPFYFHLGEALRKSDKKDEACDAFTAYLARDPADHMGAAIKLALAGGCAAPPTLPPEYIRSLFDQYAPKFEQCLVTNLHYHAPEEMAQAVRAVRAGPYGHLLDLGCGTGLVAAQFPDAARRTGVDLSPVMIEESKKKNIYDALHVQGLTEFLQNAAPAAFDLVLCADVFIYVGVLDDVFAHIARVLAPNGIFAFSVQSTDGTGWILGEDHRYAHSAAYVAHCAQDAQLTIIKTEPVTLRLEGGEAVPGSIVLCTRSS